MTTPEIASIANATRSEVENVTDLDSLTAQAQQLSQSADAWNAAMLWALGGAAIVAIAIVVTTRMALVRAGQLADAQGQIVAFANQKAGEANARAAKLEKDAEDERTARVELEAKVAWRKLSPEAQTRMAGELHRFAKEPALVSYNREDIEAATFASEIATALHSAQWDVPEALELMKLREGPVPIGTNPRLPTGVLVWHTDDDQSRAAASALVRELSQRGFDTRLTDEIKSLLGLPNFRPHPAPGRVVVSVEHKPEEAQGEYKLRAQTAHAK